MVFPYRATRRGRVPSGPIVVAINHLSHVDPPIAGLAIRRPTRFLALDELWGNAWILDRLFRVFGAIPLPRTDRRPIAAIRAALRELERGGSVGVFPEGRRVQVWGDAELKRGAAWLSVRTGAPLVPMAIWGTQHAMPIERMRLHRAEVAVVICAPLDPAHFTDEADPIGALTDAWRQAVDRELANLRAPT